MKNIQVYSDKLLQDMYIKKCWININFINLCRLFLKLLKSCFLLNYINFIHLCRFFLNFLRAGFLSLNYINFIHLCRLFVNLRAGFLSLNYINFIHLCRLFKSCFFFSREMYSVFLFICWLVFPRYSTVRDTAW